MYEKKGFPSNREPFFRKLTPILTPKRKVTKQDVSYEEWK